MKYIFLSIGIMMALAVQSQVKTDTVFTSAIFAYDWGRSDYRIITAKKVYTSGYKEKDSIAEIRGKDTLFTKVKSWFKDSTYLVPIVDTARTAQGKAIFEKGKPKFQLYWPSIPKEMLLFDFNKNWK